MTNEEIFNENIKIAYAIANRYKKIIKRYIPKDKIREKIKKAEKELKELGDLQFYDYEKYIQTETQAKIFCLEQTIKDYKELLEGK